MDRDDAMRAAKRVKTAPMRILIGHDGSETAERAMEDLAKAGLPRKAEAIILVAIPPLLPPGMVAPEGYAVNWFAEAYSEAVRNVRRSESLAKAKGTLASRRLKRYFPGWSVSMESCLDAPSHAILKRADEWHPDMIVLGSHGWNPIGKLLLGSVAEKVLVHAHGNVRIGKTRPTRKAAPPRLLIGFDGSPESLAAVETVAGRHWPKGTEARLVAVSDFQFRIDQMEMASRNRGAQSARLPDGPWPWMEIELAKAARRLESAGIGAGTALLAGDPRHVLLAQARKFKADTLFLGNRGISGLRRFLLGSVSAAVAAHSPCSIEIIRIPAEKG